MSLTITARRAALANLSAAMNAVRDEEYETLDSALCDLTETTLFASTDPSITSLPATEISDAAYDAAYRVLSEARRLFAPR